MKYFWKLLQLDAGKLSYKLKYSRSFKQMLFTYEIVKCVLDCVLDDSPELERYYLFYQNCLSDLKRKNITSLYQNILRHKHQVNAYFTPVLNTMLKYRSYVENTLIYPYSNAGIECQNNHIKVLKRIAYGSQNFEHFKKRIFLVLVKTIRLEP